MLQGVDVSHWQGNPDWPAVRGAGYEFAILKATEGTGYADPGCDVNRARAHAAGMSVVGLYHFARGGDPVQEANYFAAHVGPLAGDEFPVLDWEISPPGLDPVAWCAAFCDTVRARTGKLPAVVYMNGPRVARYDWSPLAAMGVRLWLAGDGVNAAYDNDPRPVTVKWWGQPALKQYTETGSVPGIGGGVDLNVFYGTKTDLAAFAAGNEEDDMTPEQDSLLRDIDARLRGPVDRNYDMLQSIESALYGNMPAGQNNFHWLGAQISALTAAVQAIAAAPGGISSADIVAAAKAGADDALAELGDVLKPTT